MYVILHHNSSNRALRRRGFVSYFVSVIPPVEFLLLALVSVTAFVFQVESVYSNMMLCRLCQESSSVSFTLKEWFTKKQNKLHLIFLMLLQTFIFFFCCGTQNFEELYWLLSNALAINGNF